MIESIYNTTEHILPAISIEGVVTCRNSNWGKADIFGAQGHFGVVVFIVVVVVGDTVVEIVVWREALPSRCSLNVALGCLMS